MKKVNLTGRTFGYWQVLREDFDRPANGHSKWICKCVCGKERSVDCQSLLRGASVSCGCIKPDKFIDGSDYINRVFGRLTVISLVDPIKDSDDKYRTAYLCHCSCGNDLIVSRHHLQNKSGRRSCGCLNDENRSKLGLSKRKLPPDLASGKVLYEKAYSDGNISFKDFCRISKLNCFYCDKEPSNSHNKYLHRDKWGKNSDFAKENGTFIYNGLDRIDSSRGHDLDNVVPCCFQCNRSKSDKSLDEFGEWICHVYCHWAKKYGV